MQRKSSPAIQLARENISDVTTMADFEPPAWVSGDQRRAADGSVPQATPPDPDISAGGDAPDTGAGTTDNTPNDARNELGRADGQHPDAKRAYAWNAGPSQHPTSPHRQAYAAIDLGTNNCRLLIARPSGDHFVVVDAFSRVVRLGEGLSQTGRLSDISMERALAALHVCADKLRKRNVHLARSVATEACRRATNGAAFIERVYEETGIRLDIITAQEEARLAVLGCHILLEQGEGPAMIFDIGGGSTELVLVDPQGTVPRIIDWQSVPWGVVSLTESVGPIADSKDARAAAYADMRGQVDDAFAPFVERIAQARETGVAQGNIRLLGTSGTVTTLASVYLELPHYDRNAIDGLVVPADAMRDISQRMAAMSLAERIALPCIGRERSDLVVAGCAILESILDVWPATRLGIADRGIREGILRSLMASEGVAERSRAALRNLRRDRDTHR
ncbi:Ppx/GppA phosphatase family protein [Novosphingobium sp.]|uniref:Ppx/GppA phosphatase family protein n=1 Tax=Novosphingobium sp. TaxID=1874826 RepID=UPI0025D18341|nr:Ppx/GppA phosphatase family protein [Novosphingobium sp.]